MATYTETFPNNGTLGVTTEDLTWVGGALFFATVTSGVADHSGTYAYARAEHDTATDDMFVQADWVTGGAGKEITLVGRCGDQTTLDSDKGISLFVSYDGTDTAVTISGWFPTGSIAGPTILAGTSPVATWRLELEGTACRAYRNGVLVNSGTSALSPQPSGTRAGFYFDTTGPLAIDNFTYGDLTVTGGPSIDRTTDVPFLQANDRYQVIACVKAGTSTTTSQFRYWYANAPAWDLALESDSQYPPFHTLDEDSAYPTASIETPFKDLKTGQEDQIQGVYVEYTPRPTSLTEATVTSTYTIGFTCRVEGISTPNYSRTVGTGTLISGIVVSTNQVVEITAEVNASDTWPNIRTVFLPCRMPGKVRAARVILSDIHLSAIRRVQLMGKLTPGRDA